MRTPRSSRSQFPPLSLSGTLVMLALAACADDQPLTAPGVNPDAPTAAVLGQRVVNSFADPGDGVCDTRQCTLREAIADAGSTAISFAPGLSGVITLGGPAAGGGTLVIDKALTITGPSTGITIRRRATDPEFRILRIGSNGVVTLRRLILRNGKTSSPGGGIMNFGTLALIGCTVADNVSTQHGGGIDNHGPLTLRNTIVAGNSGSVGGGVHNHTTDLTLTGSTVTRNSGSGIGSEGGTLLIRGGKISDNSGAGVVADRAYLLSLDSVRVVGNGGRGVSARKGATRLTNSTVARNSGGVYNEEGSFDVANTTIANNSTLGPGGGIFNTVQNIYGRGSSRMTLTNSTVSGNSAATGGGIENADEEGGASVAITNSTIANNAAQEAGGGIHQSGGVENGNSIWLTNSLLALNSAPIGPDAYSASPDSYLAASFSLIGDGTASGLANEEGNQVGNVSPNSSPIDPLIGPLARNGGPSATHALLAGSPALDAGTLEGCPATDQRGVGRPQGTTCDMGSYERE